MDFPAGSQGFLHPGWMPSWVLESQRPPFPGVAWWGWVGTGDSGEMGKELVSC